MCKKPDEGNGGGGEQQAPGEPAEGGEQQAPGEPAVGEEQQAPGEPAGGEEQQAPREQDGLEEYNAYKLYFLEKDALKGQLKERKRPGL